MSVTAALLVSLALLIANAWFVLFEFALVRMRGSRLTELEDRGVPSAPVARRMHGRMNDYLGACQLGITIASLGIGWLAEPALSSLLEPYLESAWAHAAALVAAFVLITLVHIVVGELVPKAVAIQAPERALLWSAQPMRLFHALFYLPLQALNAMANLILRSIGMSVRPHEEPSLSVEEIRIVVADSYRQGEVSLDRSLLLGNALNFGSLTAGAVMTTLARAQTIDVKTARHDVLETVAQRKLSRYLLTDGGHVTGYFHVKDLLMLGAEATLGQAKRELLTVPREAPLDVVLRRMQRERTQIALVTSLDGANVGLVTMEDVLEELVGEVHDEFEEVRVWNLADHVATGAAMVDLSLSDRDEAIRSLVDAIARNSPEVRPDAAELGVQRREAQASTALGQTVALPHARLPGLSRTYVAIARVKPALSWREGGEPVRFVFLILTPAEMPLEQNRALMRVATLVRDEVLFARLAEAPTPEALLEVVRAADVLA